MTNSVDLDRSSLIWVYTVCSGLSVWKLGIITVPIASISKFFDSLAAAAEQAGFSLAWWHNSEGRFPHVAHLSHVTRKSVFGVSDPVRLKLVCSVTQTSWSRESGFSRYRYYTILVANNKGADQTVQMCRLSCTFVVRIWQKQVFSWRGLNDSFCCLVGATFWWNYCLICGGNF